MPGPSIENSQICPCLQYSILDMRAQNPLCHSSGITFCGGTKVRCSFRQWQNFKQAILGLGAATTASQVALGVMSLLYPPSMKGNQIIAIILASYRGCFWPRCLLVPKFPLQNSLTLLHRFQQKYEAYKTNINNIMLIRE